MPLSPQPLDEIDPIDDPGSDHREVTGSRDDRDRNERHAPSDSRAASGAVVPPVRLAGWYPDPRGRYDVRYWDGTRWTFRVGSVNLPPEGASVPESDFDIELTADSPQERSTSPKRRWRTRLLIAGLGFLAVTGWGFGIMKAKAATPALSPPASTPASVPAK